MLPVILVDRPGPVAEAEAKLRAASWAAVDTEADSLHHYTEKFCLLQISIEAEDYVIDPLAGVDVSPLVRALDGKFLILHGADFDLKMMRTAHAVEPREIFDTMIAAQLLGYEKQGLADLAARHCGVTLVKTNQKADWSRRPLDAGLLEYAVKDTHYLRTIQSAMEKELEDLGRRQWLRENCAKLLETVRANAQEAPAEDPDRPRWLIKGAKKLSGKGLAVLKELWTWREEEAKRADRPPFKVLNSEYLIPLAEWMLSGQGGDVAEWPKAPRNVRKNYRDVLNAIARRVPELAEIELAKPKRDLARKKWGGLEDRRLEGLKRVRETLAKELKISPSLLATNAVLEKVILASPKDLESFRKESELLPWQVRIVGEPFLKALASPPPPAKKPT